MWLHKHQLNELISENHSDVEKCSIDNREHRDKYQAIKCAVCHDHIMKKINFLDYSDIIMDYCPGCGSFWIDKDELNMMHEYLREIEESSQGVTDRSAYSILSKISQIAYQIYH
jgi:Zn-finger nucleic acid-binding protein